MNSKIKGDMAEEFVNKIAYSTFLKYWCYPNPRDIAKDNKEICDLLVVFDSVCIIISVKNYSFHGNYGKYFRHTVDNAIRQILGAERKLFGDRQILLQHPDRNAELFPKERVKTVLRIIVNANTDPKFYRPVFHINETVRITIFDSDAWCFMLNEIDTIQDVINYLKGRDRLFKGRPSLMLPREEHDFDEADAIQLADQIERDQFEKKSWVLISGSEKDLIAYYISNAFSFPKELDIDTRPFLYIKVDGMWDKFEKSKLNFDKKEYEKISYFLDHLVKEHLINQPNGDKISKAFYRLDRLQRARFTDHFFKFYNQQRLSNPQPLLHRSNVSFNNLHFIFIYFNTKKTEMTDELLAGFIEKSLHYRDYLMSYKCEEVIAIAFSQDLYSCAFGYLSNENPLSWKERIELEHVYRELGWRMLEDS